LIEWQRRYGKDGLVIIAIAPGYQPMAREMLKNIAKGMGINYKLAQWEKEQNKLPKPLSLVPSYPASLLIDRQGRLRGGVFGPWLTQLESQLRSPQGEINRPQNRGQARPVKRAKVAKVADLAERSGTSRQLAPTTLTARQLQAQGLN